MYNDLLIDLKQNNEKKFKDFVEATLYTHPYRILTELYNKVINSYDYESEKKIQYLEATLLDIITNNTSGYDLNDQRLVNNLYEIKKFYWELFNKSKDKENAIVYQSLLFNNLDIISKIFNKEEMNEIKEYDSHIYEAIIKIHNKRIVSRDDLSILESHILYTYLLGNLDNKNKELQEIIDMEAYYLIHENKELDRYELSFLANYIAKNTWNSIDTTRPRVYISEINALGVCKSGTKTVVLNSCYVGKPFFGAERKIRNYERFDDASTTLFHELNHQFQFANVEKDFFTLTGFYMIATSIIEQLDEDSNKSEDDETTDYKRNYKFKEIETESNMMSYYYTYYLLSQIDPTRAEIYREGEIYYKEKLSKSYQIDEDSKSYEIITYNINMIKKVLEKHPEFFQQYKILELIFNRDGSIKTLKQFMILYYNREKNNEGLDYLYMYFLKYYIYNSKELGIDFSKVDLNRQTLNFELLSFLQKYVLEEIESIEQIFHSIKRTDDIKKIEEVIIIKCESINKALAAIKRQRTSVITDYISNLFKEDKIGIKRIKEFKETLDILSQKNLNDLLKYRTDIYISLKTRLAIQGVQLSLNEPWINNNKQMMKRIIDVKTSLDKKKTK